MPEEIRRLSEAFAAPSHSDWQRRVEQALRGRGDADSLTSRSFDGLAVRPLYRRADLPEMADPSGFPGFLPHLRGTCADGRGWQVRQRHAHPDPGAANRQILKDLERGVTAVTLAIDPDGRCGTVVRSKADLAEALDGVDMTLAPIALEAGRHGTAAAAMLLALWEEQDADPGAVRGHLGLDPLGALAAEGTCGNDPDGALTELGTLAGLLDERYPQATAATVSTRAYHSAGASEAQELGAMLATAVAYLRAMEAAGVAPAAAARRIAFTLMADADLPLTIAKLRAARALWAQILDACGIAGGQAMWMTAETAPRMLTRRDAWTNILRTSLAAFAAAAGGAEAITVHPHDSALGVPTDFARRISRNVQSILAEESHIGRVMDPAGGAFAFEALTRDLAQHGWAEFQRIESEGGMAASLAEGAVHGRIAEMWGRRAAAIARREEPVVGVSEYPDLGEQPVAADRPDPAPTIAKADSRAGDAAPADRSWSALIAAAGKGAALATLAGRGGAEATSVAPLPVHRLGEAFEALRDKSDSIFSETGTRPRVFLACLGSLAEHTARAGWAQALYAAGGIEAVAGTGGTEAQAIAEEWRNCGAAEAALCGPDALYVEHLAPVAEALKAAGARHLAMIGNPGNDAAAWTEAGVDEYLYAGIDVLSALEAIYARMGDGQ